MCSHTLMKRASLFSLKAKKLNTWCCPLLVRGTRFPKQSANIGFPSSTCVWIWELFSWFKQTIKVDLKSWKIVLSLLLFIPRHHTAPQHLGYGQLQWSSPAALGSCPSCRLSCRNSAGGPQWGPVSLRKWQTWPCMERRWSLCTAESQN